MTGAEHERARVVAFLRLYAEINMEMCGDGILMDPILSGKGWSPQNERLSDQCSTHSTIHSAKFHACNEMADAIERGEHLAKTGQ